MDKVYAIGLVAAVGVVAGGAFVACSSSSSDNGQQTTDSGVHPGDTGTGGGDTGTVTDSGTVNDTGSSGGDTGPGGTDCGSDPSLHPSEAGVGPYCPGFSPDGGTGSGSCTGGQTCCEQPKGTPSTCASSPAGCTVSDGGTVWECDQTNMCTTGVCCGYGAPALRSGCTYDEVFPPNKGSHCAASCAADEYQICEGPGECPTGKTCTPMKTAGKQIGYCK
jgi:hypothetical protein